MSETMTTDEIERAFEALEGHAGGVPCPPKTPAPRRPASYSEALVELANLRRELAATQARVATEKARRRAAENKLARRLGGR